MLYVKQELLILELNSMLIFELPDFMNGEEMKYKKVIDKNCYYISYSEKFTLNSPKNYILMVFVFFTLMQKI